MADLSVHFSSETDNWATPQCLFDKLDAEFGFTVDVCADNDNAKCEQFFTKEQNGLNQDWTGIVWCNPPYGRSIGHWVAKAKHAADEIRFVRGRLKFGKAKNCAPFPSAVVVFRGGGSALRVRSMSRGDQS